MAFIYRLLPMFTAALVAGAFYAQFSRPFDFPYWAAVGVVCVPAAAFLIARRRVAYADMAEKMLPTLLLVAALAFAMLLSEGALSMWLIILLAGTGTYLSLELLFFLAFMPSRYPVNGLSRVNIAYVPLTVWYAVATSTGLMTFLHSPAWLHVAGMVLLGVIIFRTTGHPEATIEQNRRWMLVGAFTGLHLGLLGMVLPVSMTAQGALGMLLFSAILRMRRYLYHPLPGRRQAFAEAIAALVILGVTLGTARWL